MLSRRTLWVICGAMACTSANPAYEDSGPSDVSGTTETTGGPDAGPGTVGPDDTSPMTTQGPTGTTADDATVDDATADTGPLPGCARPPLEGEICQEPEVLEPPGGCVPGPVQVADVYDDDGFDDVLVACIGGELLLYPGQPVGIGEPQAIGPADAAGPSPREIAVDDLDGNGLLDVVVVNETLIDSVRVLWHEDDGAFTMSTFQFGAPNPTSVVIGTWFGGELPDILGTIPSANTVERLRHGKEPRGFDMAPFLPIPAPEPVDLDLGYFDEGDVLDMVVASQSGTTTVLYGNGMNGGVNEMETVEFNQGNTHSQVLVNDVEDNDSDDVLYILNGMTSMGLLRNLGGGAFDQSDDVYGEQLLGIAAGDFDHNGRPDAALADRTGEAVVFVMLRDDPEMSITMETYDLQALPWSIAAGHIDDDDIDDVVVSLEDTGELVVLQSQPG